MNHFIEWLDISSRRPGPENRIHVSVKGPLYAASAVFERTILNDGRWTISANLAASLPLRPKWSEVVEVTGHFSQLPAFESHVDKQASKVRPVRWVQEGQRLSLQTAAAAAELSIEIPAAPVVSSADLFFLLQDVWTQSSGPRGLLAVAARKIFALRLENKVPGEIRGQLAIVDEPNKVTDWPAAYLRSFQGKTYDFVLGWSESNRMVTALDVKIPILGRVRATVI